MLQPAYKTKFSRDLKRITKRGYDIEKLKTVIDMLIDEKLLGKKIFRSSFEGMITAIVESAILSQTGCSFILQKKKLSLLCGQARRI